MSPVAVEIRSPIDDLSSFPKPNPIFTTTANASSSGLFQDRGSMYSSSSSCSSSQSGLGNGAEFVSGAASAPVSGFQTAPRASSGRVKLRLVKLRKPLHGGRARAAASSEVRSGFNPFASLGTSSKDNTTKLSSNGFCLGNNVSDCNNSFVFGANLGDSSVNGILLEKGDKSENEGVNNESSDEAGFSLVNDQNCLSSNTNFKLKESSKVMGDCDLGMNTGNCGLFFDKQEKQSRTECHSVSPTRDSNSNRDGSGREGVFVFGSSNKKTLNTPECNSYSDFGENFQDSSSTAAKHGKVPSCWPEFAFKLHDELNKLNINDPLNVHGGEADEKLSKVNTRAAFDFSSCQNVAMHQMEAATPPPPSFSSIAQSFQQHNSVTEEQIKSSSTSTADGTGVPIYDFKIPQMDLSSLKKNLFTQVGIGRDSSRRSRLSKDKKTKQVKEKLKQSNHSSKQNLSQVPVQTEIQSDGKLDSGSYSPMEFSPYGVDSSAGDFPTKSPLGSSKPPCLNDHGNICSDNGAGAAVSSVRDEQESNSTLQFPFASGLEDDKAFMFSVSSSTPTSESLSLRKRQTQTRRGLKKASRNAPTSVVCSLSSTPQNQTEDAATSNTVNKTEKDVEFKQGSSSSSTIFDACEMWRLRGNQAYRNGDMVRAEACYTQGINSVPLGDNLESYVKPLALSYSNRAAARISLGRLREALGDCKAAASLDPVFLKVYIRAANCHLVLGEVEDAVRYFNKCVELSSGVCLDRRTTIEAAEGLQKAEKVAKCINQTNDLLKKKTSEAAVKALDILAEALSISSRSQKLVHMKAEALFIVQRYSEVIELCEGILHINDKNTASSGSDAGLWWFHMIAKSHFSMGNLEMALDQLQKLPQVGSNITEHQNEIIESSNSLAATVSELLQCKNAGNEAVRGGRYAEAVEQYTTALSKNVLSRPFAAICFCNRAAANQALNQIADAIADCSLSMALDGNYKKAVSRRAMLHEMIRDYGQAANDLQRLIIILEKQCDKRTKTPNSSGGPMSSKKELRQARNRLSVLVEEAKKGIQLDLYLILGVKTSDAAADIKKAYRKAALKHHPDKAGQLLVRSDGGDDGRIWKEIAEEVQNDADRLFKMIGEAYAVLSDPTKKSEYDADEAMRKARISRENSRSSGRRNPYDENGYPYECSPNRRNWKENRKTYGSTPYWW